MEATVTTEKPLSPGAKAALMFGAGLTILMFYLIMLVVIILLLALMLCELAILIVLLRFGLAGFMMRILQKHLDIVTICFKSQWLGGKSYDFRLPLEEEDAPGLFAMVQGLATRLEIEPPQVVYLEMSLGAWVQLKGYRQGKGKTVLGVGYDLLAGLSQAEMEGVMAHEMTHAKLIQRGLKGWLVSGFNRLINLTNHLRAEVDAYERGGQSNDLAAMLHKGADALTKLALRQISAYSRQDEFEADHGAAELCGAAKIRSSLLRLESLEEITSKLPWKERVARLQLEGGYSRWLRQELAKADSLPKKPHAEMFNKYSTHPLISDRVAALPDDGSSLPTVAVPAIDLLANPDEVADKLVVEIQKKQAEAEEADSKELKKLTRKVQGGGHVRPLQVLGIFIVIVGCFLGLAGMVDMPRSAPMFIGGCAAVVGGVLLYRFGKYKDKTPLPVPEYSVFIQAWRDLDELKEWKQEQNKLEKECQQLAATETKKKKRTQMLATECYASLQRGEYLRAHVAARLCLHENSEQVEGVIGYTIAAAALGMNDQVGWAFARLKQLTGLKSTETSWAAGWALLMVGDLAHAEAFLETALAKRPLEATWRLMLALAQARRGKLQVAIKNAREACALKPEEIEGAKLFVNLLVESGYFREAQEQLEKLGDKVNGDPELMLAQVRVLLIQQNIEGATHWAELLKENGGSGQQILRLGEAYEEARQHDYAAGCFTRALQVGFYPAAYLGLGRIEADRNNHPVARAYYLSALEMKRSLGEKATGPLALFPQTIGHLLTLSDPALNCRAWVATLTGGASPDELKHQSFLVFAHDQSHAEQYFDAVLTALRKDMPPLLPGSLIWREATAKQQPDGPVRPGVQGVIS